jgi:hypothetical protein
VSRVVYFDCASGASGDMLLGALVDLGLPLEALQAELRKLPLDGWRLEARRVSRSGVQAAKVDVIVEERPHGHHHGHAHAHVHRGLGDILRLLEAGTLAPEVKERCAALFRRLAEAEAAVHGTSVDEVHFHEVGAVDSIVDVVGVTWGLTSLGAARFVASPLNLGTGFVSMSHGTFPVPPPATVRLVQGVPVFGAGEGELLTPTGALLVTGFAASYGPLPLMRPRATGYGAGTRESRGRPNVVRLIVGDEDDDAARERLVVLEAQVDDMSPQLVGALVEKLLDEGALDAFAAPVHMKKGRPGLLLSVLARPEARDALEELLFRESTTLGVRARECERTALEREVVQVATAYGDVGVKIGRRAGRVYNAQPEFDDCRRAAAAHGVPVKEVWAAAFTAWRRETGRA